MPRMFQDVGAVHYTHARQTDKLTKLVMEDLATQLTSPKLVSPHNADVIFFSTLTIVTPSACGNCKGTLQPMFESRTPKTPRSKVPVAVNKSTGMFNILCVVQRVIEAQYRASTVLGLGGGSIRGHW